MAAIAPPAATAPAEQKLPGAIPVGLKRARVELISYLRNRQAVMFTFALPVVLLLLFGSIFKGNASGTNVPMRQVLISGIIASGIMSTTFSSLAIGIAVARDDGTLHRLAATPMPKAAFFIGKLAMAFAAGIAETVVLLGLGVGIYGLHLPNTPERWFTLFWVVLLGIGACAMLGVAYSSIARNGRSAPAVVQLPYLTLQMISGVYFVFTQMPKSIQSIAAVFPLKWIAQGLRSAFLPDSFMTAEPANSWEHPKIALILGAWCVGAFLICLVTFTWRTRDNA
jgi:ABC-2 type transport system permease protein